MKSRAKIIFDDELDQLEMRIAQRADELARRDPSPSGTMPAWERAEKEVWSAVGNIASGSFEEITSQRTTQSAKR